MPSKVKSCLRCGASISAYRYKKLREKLCDKCRLDDALNKEMPIEPLETEKQTQSRTRRINA